MFQGQSGYLDHALASSSLAAQATGAAEWHINADEPIALDYNVEFKSANHVDTLVRFRPLSLVGSRSAGGRAEPRPDAATS